MPDTPPTWTARRFAAIDAAASLCDVLLVRACLAPGGPPGELPALDARLAAAWWYLRGRSGRNPDTRP